MKSFITLVVIVTAILLSSCKDNSTAPRSSPAFSLNVSVTDTTGAPVPNLRVSGGSLISIPDFMGQGVRAWANGAYYARLTARDTAGGSVLYQDSILMVLGDVDIGNPPAWLGYTSSAGMLSLRDVSRFPGVLPLPPIPETTLEDPTPVSEFSILDTVMLILDDTSTHREQVVRKAIGNGDNVINIVWKPAAPSGSSSAIARIERGPDAPSLNAQANNQLNGFRPAAVQAATAILFDLLQAADVTLTVVRLDGSIISTLVGGRHAAGAYLVVWNANEGLPHAFGDIHRRSGAVDVRDWKLYQNYPNPFN